MAAEDKGAGRRVAKDLNDVVQLIELNVRAAEFRQLCLRYGNLSLYEKLVSTRK